MTITPDVRTCPIDADFDPLSEEYLDDPYAHQNAVRDRGPIFYSPRLDMYVLTRYEDIEAVFRNPSVFSATIQQQPVFDLAPETKKILVEKFTTTAVMSDCDPPMHTRIRALNMKGFSARRIAALEPRVRAKTIELIDRIEPGPVDMVAALSYPLPAFVVSALIGFPEEDADRIKAWCGNRIEFSWGAPSVAEQAEVANNMVSYWEYCQRFVEFRKENPADDFTSYLLAAHRENPESISEYEIANVTFGLSFAGHETTTSLAGSALRRLLSRRQLWEEICADPSLIPGAVEEMLRYDSAVIAWRRRTTREVTVAGVEIPQGATVLLLLGAANHDPSHFHDPEVLDIRRADAKAHLAFGKGIHFCLGAALARVEGRVILEELTKRAPEMTLLPQEFTFPRNISFRGPKQLWVQWPGR
ncbi:cytochrome P450 [Nocardia sp. CA2R105]|uniref:cytochrome P450 n=1 Tax=Nocardia coffeae TaxID=2873381 RepID=UPI001CA76B82|nr:cytochrome P450 [Nocardia coffeae]MBY8863529.1 cytochrome P450 [Nocardia coffeae]